MGSRSSSDIFTNLSHLLPTGTFLTFQSLAPLFTNNGECRTPERVVTGILLFLFFVLCFCMSFVDSVTTETGKVYYGLVTTKGLYNPAFKKSKFADDQFDGDEYFTGGSDYKDDFTIKFNDFTNGALNVITFGALSCLSPPVTTCYYPGISPTIVKTGPVLAAIVVGALFAVFPSGRHGIGYTQTSAGIGLVPENGPTRRGPRPPPPGAEADPPPSDLPPGPNPTMAPSTNGASANMLLLKGVSDVAIEMEQTTKVPTQPTKKADAK